MCVCRAKCKPASNQTRKSLGVVAVCVVVTTTATSRPCAYANGTLVYAYSHAVWVVRSDILCGRVVHTHTHNAHHNHLPHPAPNEFAQFTLILNARAIWDYKNLFCMRHTLVNYNVNAKPLLTCRQADGWDGWLWTWTL